MPATQVWVHFDGPGSRYTFDLYWQILRDLFPGPKVPPEYHLVARPELSECWQSINLRVENHGGPVSADRIQEYLQHNLAPSHQVCITAAVFVETDATEQLPQAS